MEYFGYFQQLNKLPETTMAPTNKENKSRRRKSQGEYSGDNDEYRKKRDKNNLAVKRSRDKTKQKTKQTLDRVVQLKTENETLEEKINLLTKELSFLKDLFLAHAGSSNGMSFSGMDLEAILSENQDSSSSAIWKLLSDPSFKINKPT